MSCLRTYLLTLAAYAMVLSCAAQDLGEGALPLERLEMLKSNDVLFFIDTKDAGARRQSSHPVYWFQVHSISNDTVYGGFKASTYGQLNTDVLKLTDVSYPQGQRSYVLRDSLDAVAYADPSATERSTPLKSMFPSYTKSYPSLSLYKLQEFIDAPIIEAYGYRSQRGSKTPSTLTFNHRGAPGQIHEVVPLVDGQRYVMYSNEELLHNPTARWFSVQVLGGSQYAFTEGVLNIMRLDTNLLEHYHFKADASGAYCVRITPEAYRDLLGESSPEVFDARRDLIKLSIPVPAAYEIKNVGGEEGAYGAIIVEERDGDKLRIAGPFVIEGDPNLVPRDLLLLESYYKTPEDSLLRRWVPRDRFVAILSDERSWRKLKLALSDGEPVEHIKSTPMPIRPVSMRCDGFRRTPSKLSCYLIGTDITAVTAVTDESGASLLAGAPFQLSDPQRVTTFEIRSPDGELPKVPVTLAVASSSGETYTYRLNRNEFGSYSLRLADSSSEEEVSIDSGSTFKW